MNEEVFDRAFINCEERGHTNDGLMVQAISWALPFFKEVFAVWPHLPWYMPCHVIYRA